MLRQASETAETNLINGISVIDEFLGKGFARDHPDLIGAFIQATATIYAAEITARQTRAGVDGIAEALHAANLNSHLDAIAPKVPGDYSVQAKGFDGISSALRELVEATRNIAGMTDIIGKQMPTQYE
jgi:hypothetical protein